jgi:[acyl-carrier-protein] S-malonyltransferase
MSTAFIFPGQGSQAPGMGKGLYVAFGASREVFQEIDEALGEKLSKLIFEGPAEELTLTANAQPALMAVSLAAMRALEKEFGVGVCSSPVTRSANIPRSLPLARSPSPTQHVCYARVATPCRPLCL